MRVEAFQHRRKVKNRAFPVAHDERGKYRRRHCVRRENKPWVKKHCRADVIAPAPSRVFERRRLAAFEHHFTRNAAHKAQALIGVCPKATAEKAKTIAPSANAITKFFLMFIFISLFVMPPSWRLSLVDLVLTDQHFLKIMRNWHDWWAGCPLDSQQDAGDTICLLPQDSSCAGSSESLSHVHCFLPFST